MTPRHATDEIQQLIVAECRSVESLLLRKNRDYGNSALSPARIFSRAETVEQIKVRIDDKLSRLACSSAKTINEDTVMDLIGYLILLRVATKLNQQHERRWSSRLVKAWRRLWEKEK